MTLTFATADADTIPLHIVEKDGFDDWISGRSDATRDWLTQLGFTGELGKVAMVPGADGPLAFVGFGTAEARARSRFALARAQAALPPASYAIANPDALPDPAEAALGWLLSEYRFTRYVKDADPGARLVAPDGIDVRRIEVIANGEALTRDLINTPASDMGRDALQTAMQDLAAEHGADLSVTVGDDLLRDNFPMIHTVGRASDKAPRLLDMRWGDTGPRLTLVGKGVCFDTGGLNIKPAASMGLMKKDMGGAATVMGLARMIMALNLPLRLRVLVPAVENSISAGAFRPQDILTSRKGLTVEINNTDAEGRLVLADALALACEEPRDLLISMATLTGAARVAVGPDLAPFYASSPALADAIRKGAETATDPVWEMPFHDPYEEMIEPGIADLDNAPRGGFAGSITAALFLRRFTDGASPYAHFDIYGWQPSAAPARPKGGVGQGARAILDALPALLKL